MIDVKPHILMSIAFSVFGMLLVFGLGFVFPTINPYIVIKWIIAVAGVVFIIAFIKYIWYWVELVKGWIGKKGKKSAKSR